jgi:hypothetical protein
VVFLSPDFTMPRAVCFNPFTTDLFQRKAARLP